MIFFKFNKYMTKIAKTLSLSFVFSLCIWNNLNCQHNSDIISGIVGKQLDRFFSKAETNGFAGVIMVVKDGEILLRKGYGIADADNNVSYTSTTSFNMGSIEKQFCASAILKLEMMGKLDVYDPITKFFSNVPDDKKEITIHQLLTHTSGLNHMTNEDVTVAITKEDAEKRIMAQKLEARPGEKFTYSNSGYGLLAMIVEKVSGIPYEKFMRDNLFIPAGMNNTGYVLHKYDKKNVATGIMDGVKLYKPYEVGWLKDGLGWALRGAGGFLITVDDFYKWHLALEGDKILSEEAKKKLYTPHVPKGKVPGAGGPAYGYGWFLKTTDRNTPMIEHGGNFGSYSADFRRFPEDNLVIIAGGNTLSNPPRPLLSTIEKIIYGKYTELNANIIKTYTGVYRLPSGSKMNVSFDENNSLKIEFTDFNSLIAANGSEGLEDTEAAKEKSQFIKTAWEESAEGNYEKTHKVLGGNATLEEYSKTSDNWWKEMKEKYGAFKSVDVLGSVERPNGFIISYMTVKHVKGEIKFLHVWNGERITQSFPIKKYDMFFTMRNEQEFFSGLAGKTITLGMENDKLVIIIKGQTKQVKAEKEK